MMQALTKRNELLQEIQNLQTLIEQRDSELRYAKRNISETNEQRQYLTRDVQENVSKVQSLEVI